MIQALVPLAPGCEEIEAVTLIDVFRRAGWTVHAAGLNPGPVKASRGVVLVPDLLLDEVDPDALDLMVLPGGGGGTEALAADPRIAALARKLLDRGKLVAAICAAPSVLFRAGLLENRRFTAYPGVLDDQGAPGYDPGSRVVDDGPVVTSRGPGTAMEFALHLVGRFERPEAVRALADALLVQPPRGES